MIEVKDLCFSYYRQPLCLKDINFSIEKNRKVLLLGSEGMGKTTLLLNLTGIEDSYFGQIKINGKDAKKLTDLEKNISFLPSKPVLLQNKTIYENFEYLFSISGITKTKEEIEEVLKQFNIDRSLDVKVKKLSLFEKKKLAFARSYIKQPDIFLVDEQSEGLSSEEEEKIIELYKKLLNYNCTAICAVCSETYKKRKNLLKLLKFDEYFYVYDANLLKYKSMQEFEDDKINIDCLKFLEQSYYNFGTYLEFQDKFFNIYFEDNFISIEGNIFDKVRKKLNLKTGEQEDIIISSITDLDFSKLNAEAFVEKIESKEVFIFSKIDGERLI